MCIIIIVYGWAVFKLFYIKFQFRIHFGKELTTVEFYGSVVDGKFSKDTKLVVKAEREDTCSAGDSVVDTVEVFQVKIPKKPITATCNFVPDDDTTTIYSNDGDDESSW